MVNGMPSVTARGTPTIPFTALAALLQARPEWRWEFKLCPIFGRPTYDGELEIKVRYTCQCAAREELTTWQKFPLRQLAAFMDDGRGYEHITELIFRATDENIERHTAKWRRVGLIARFVSDNSPPPPPGCRRCRGPLGASAWERTPGIPIPNDPPRGIEHYCEPCGTMTQAEH